MKRTGLFVLAAAVAALGAGVYWFMTPQSERMSAGESKSDATMSAVDDNAQPALPDQPAAAPPADLVAPAAPVQEAAPAEPSPPDAATASRDQMGRVADADERQAKARKAEEEKNSESARTERSRGYSQYAPGAAPPPPPPPPPPPVESAPQPMAPKPAPAIAPAPPPTRTTMGLAPPAHEEIPAFPWPVPKATATIDVPRQLIIGNTNAPTFGSVSERIASALDHAGYGERSYYALADGRGIAIATQLEQINDDGTPVVGLPRFEAASVSLNAEQQFSLTSYVKALFTAKGNRFRIIVFTLSGDIAQDGKAPGEDKARTWAANGATRLPQGYALIPFTDRITCTALVYEFEKKNYADAATFVPSGKVNAMSHLTRAGIWTLLGQP